MRKWMYSIDDDMTSQKEAKCTHHAPTRTPTNTARVDAVAKPVRHVSRGPCARPRTASPAQLLRAPSTAEMRRDLPMHPARGLMPGLSVH